MSTWQALRAREAERQALTARDDAAEQLRQAKRSEARAQAVLKFFQDKVLSAARPKGQEGGLSRDATVREALDRAEPEIATAFAGEPLVEASIRNTLGVSYQYLGDQEKALAQHERAIALRRQELGPGHPETVGGMNDLAIILLQMGKSAEAQEILEEVVAVKRRTLGPEDKGTLHAMTNLSIALAMQGLLEDAAKLVEEYLEIQRRVEGPESIFTLRSTYNLANHAAPTRAVGRGPAAVRRVPPDAPARLRPRPPGHAPGGQRPGRAPARPAPAGGGPSAVRGGPERDAAASSARRTRRRS